MNSLREKNTSSNRTEEQYKHKRETQLLFEFRI